MTHPRKDSFLRLPDVRRRTGMSTTTIYRKIGLGQFPRQVQVSENAVAWYESDIDRWVAAPMEWQAAA